MAGSNKNRSPLIYVSSALLFVFAMYFRDDDTYFLDHNFWFLAGTSAMAFGALVQDFEERHGTNDKVADFSSRRTLEMKASRKKLVILGAVLLLIPLLYLALSRG